MAESSWAVFAVQWSFANGKIDLTLSFQLPVGGNGMTRQK